MSILSAMDAALAGFQMDGRDPTLFLLTTAEREAWAAEGAARWPMVRDPASKEDTYRGVRIEIDDRKPPGCLLLDEIEVIGRSMTAFRRSQLDAVVADTSGTFAEWASRPLPRGVLGDLPRRFGDTTEEA